MSDTIVLGTSNLATDLSLPPQVRRILAHLESGKSITNNEAMLVYHIPRLSDCIFKLRNAGHKITMEMRKDEVGGKYARYTLDKKPVLN